MNPGKRIPMNKYLKLITNTLIFAISNFSSKLLVFLLVPLYTRVLTPDDYGVADIIINTSNLIIPFVALSISEGVIRFGLDKSVKKSDVYSSAFKTIIYGFSFFLLFIPIFSQIKLISGYTWLIYLYVFASILRVTSAQFVRSIGYVRLYAVDGVIATLNLILFNLLFLLVFHWGITGYILSTIMADLCSFMFLFKVAKLGRYIKFKSMDRTVTKAMLFFSIPMIPNTMFWWITNVSDRYMVTYMLSAAENGLYAVAYKIPTIITMLSTIFTQAWQISAITEYDDEQTNIFYTNVFKSYQSFIFMVASAIFLIIIPMTQIMADKQYFDSWQYVPFLILSVVFSCLVQFLGSVYMAAKKNKMAMLTTFAGAIVNVVLNVILIPIFGVNGAAFATFFSYFAVFIFRFLDCQRYVRIRANLVFTGLNLAVLLVQVYVILNQFPMWFWLELLLVGVIAALNIRQLWGVCRKFLDSFVNRAKGVS